MKQDRPDLDDILATVQQFLEGATAELEGEMRYHAQVSAYLIGICRREVAALAGATDTAAESTRQLCRDIRSGKLDGAWDHTFDAVLAETIAKAAVVRPDHLAPEHRPGGKEASS
jgi:hypothetical protein